MSMLTELNELLKDLDLPTHRSVVDRSGNNLSWLKKNIVPNDDNHRLIELINTPIQTLVL